MFADEFDGANVDGPIIDVEQVVGGVFVDGRSRSEIGVWEGLLFIKGGTELGCAGHAGGVSVRPISIRAGRGGP